MGGPEGVAAEAWVLQTDAGQDLLAEVASVRNAAPADLARWRRRASVEHVAAALRLAQGRRRGAAKFARAASMWFDPTGLEQATAEPVARHKAHRFEGQAVVVDLCSGVGGDTIALAGGSDVLAVDLDAGMGRRALWNAGVYGVWDRVAAVRARAESFPVPTDAWVHIDPDRRAGRGARARDLDGYRPDLAFLKHLSRTAPGGAIKLGPASDWADHFEAPDFEVEVVSLGGECKEATVWFGAAVSSRRRATSLPSGTTWTDRDGPAGAFAEVGPVLGLVFDPDPALTRSGLLDAFAAAHGLMRVAPGVDYLTGPTAVASPLVQAFEVLEVLPLDLKAIKRATDAAGVGTLEVKTRGVDLRPKAVRARLRPSGDRAATLLLAGGAGGSRAILARRPGSDPE